MQPALIAAHCTVTGKLECALAAHSRLLRQLRTLKKHQTPESTPAPVSEPPKSFDSEPTPVPLPRARRTRSPRMERILHSIEPGRSRTTRG